MKCQILFSRKNKKNISKCHPLKFLRSSRSSLVGLIFSICSVKNFRLFYNFNIGLDKSGYKVNIFLISPQIHILWVIRRA